MCYSFALLLQNLSAQHERSATDNKTGALEDRFPRGIAVIILGIGCAIARIAAGVHYPTDVVAGGVLGSLLPWFYFQVLDHCFRKANPYRQIS
jgi:membrane-associated phospholipid phosphatase